MKRVLHFYRIINLLSIDVALGAALSALFFSRLLGVAIRPAGLLCLFLTVWIIYTADHLFDVYRMNSPASTARHKFHQRHFKTLLTIMIIMTGLDMVTVCFIKAQVMLWGVGLALVVGFYFLVQSRLKFLKEIMGALLYSAGVLLPTLPMTPTPLPRWALLLMIQFCLTALINLILFSWFDRYCDVKDHRTSIITAIGGDAVRWLLTILFLLQGGITCFVLIATAAGPAALIFASMNFALLVIFSKAKFFSIHDRYRFAGDAIFFLPVLWLLIP